VSRPVSEIYAEFDKKKEAKKALFKSIFKKIKMGFFASIIMLFAYKYFTGELYIIKSHTIDYEQLDVNNAHDIKSILSIYDLQNERVIKILEESGLTFEEFHNHVEIETTIVTSEKYLEIEFTSQNTDIDWAPIYKAISYDIMIFSRANKQINKD